VLLSADRPVLADGDDGAVGQGVAVLGAGVLLALAGELVVHLEEVVARVHGMGVACGQRGAR
jgi:hypothetical protein